jgi:hypothetical protein
MSVVPAVIFSYATCGRSEARAQSAPSESAADVVTFVFGPPHGTKFVRKTKTHLKLGFTDWQQKSEWRFEIDSLAEGFLVRAIPAMEEFSGLSAQDFKRLFGSPQQLAILGFVDSLGTLDKVEGFVPLLLETTGLRNTDDSMRVAFDYALRRAFTDEWQGHYSQLSGRTIAVGTVVLGLDSLRSSRGSDPFCRTPLISAMKVERRLRFKDADCVKILFWSSSDPAELKELVGDSMLAMPDTLSSDTTCPFLTTIKGERIVDPQTMLIYYEQWEGHMTAPSLALSAERRSEDKYSYERGPRPKT